MTKNKKSSKNRKLSLTKCSETSLKAQSCVCIKTYFNISLQAFETINPTGFCCCSFPGTDLRWSLKALFGEAYGTAGALAINLLRNEKKEEQRYRKPYKFSYYLNGRQNHTSSGLLFSPVLVQQKLLWWPQLPSDQILYLLKLLYLLPQLLTVV